MRKLSIFVYRCEVLDVSFSQFGNFWISLNLNRNTTLMAYPRSTSIHLHPGPECYARLPNKGIKYYPVVTLSEQTRTAHLKRMVEIWNGAPYFALSSRATTWEAAANSCYESGAYLLTIHSQTEYDISREFIGPHQTLLLTYIGLKREGCHLNTCVLNKISNRYITVNIYFL